ncbi:hypothetical protein SUGI_1082950 [Cryptomeria japonica]|nr:hypothetical protein SUGI_1082950 [Cryptomeria japonica]
MPPAENIECKIPLDNVHSFGESSAIVLTTQTLLADNFRVHIILYIRTICKWALPIPDSLACLTPSWSRSES